MTLLTRRSEMRTFFAATAAALVLAGLSVLDFAGVRALRDAAVDLVLQIVPPPQSERIAVVDVDGASVSAIGKWPWPRSTLAQLIEAVAAARPAAIAVDLVLSGNCESGDAGNQALVLALKKAPVTLGFVLSEAPGVPMASSPIALRRPVEIPELWQSPGAEVPCPEFAEAAAGLATLSLAGGRSAAVRSTPALAAAGRELFPGLAVDAVRLGNGVGTIIAEGSAPPIVAVGSVRGRLDRSGSLLLHSSGPEVWAARTLPAVQALKPGALQLEGKIVIVGSSLPQFGALRPTAASPLAPSSQIQADSIAGLLTGKLPWRPFHAAWLEALASLGLALAVTWAALRLKPAIAAAAALAASAGWTMASLLVFAATGAILDPLFPALAALAAGAAASLSQYSAARASEASIRRSFEQRLPPVIVARLARDGANFRLEGEERTVTALFTDIEGFTAMTAHAGPRALIKLLDGYFEGVTRIITEEGGMVDKIAGDAVYALFNVPLDLDQHQARALTSAQKIIAFTEAYRRRPDALHHGFGRTRIGLETGSVVVGDVGSFGKIDYTAYGDAVNIAARLQDANKQTGTSVLAGPGLKGFAPDGWDFDSLGTIELRGIGQCSVFSPRRRGTG